eukprot:763294-Hanusia_phi.AAC.6
MQSKLPPQNVKYPTRLRAPIEFTPPLLATTPNTISLTHPMVSFHSQFFDEDYPTLTPIPTP